MVHQNIDFIGGGQTTLPYTFEDGFSGCWVSHHPAGLPQPLLPGRLGRVRHRPRRPGDGFGSTSVIANAQRCLPRISCEGANDTVDTGSSARWCPPTTRTTGSSPPPARKPGHSQPLDERRRCCSASNQPRSAPQPATMTSHLPRWNGRHPHSWLAVFCQRRRQLWHHARARHCRVGLVLVLVAISAPTSSAMVDIHLLVRRHPWATLSCRQTSLSGEDGT